MCPLEREKLSILRAMFGQRPDGEYTIQHLGSMQLRLLTGDSTGPYRIRDDLFTMQPNYLGTILSNLGQSIVPIVAMVAGEETLRCLGTGFFVSADGLLITAAHVLADPIERGYGNVREIGASSWFMGDLQLGVMIATNPVFEAPGWYFQKIEWAEFLGQHTDSPLPFQGKELKLTSDTAICKVESPPHGLIYQPLPMIQAGVRGQGLGVGKKATAIGYARMQNTQLEIVREDAVSGDFNFDLYVSAGEILEQFPNNAISRSVRTPGPCFSASLKLPGGMSGSPIFDDERVYVHGVVSGGLEDESGLASLGYGSMLAASMQVPIKQLEDATLLSLLVDGKRGMMKLNMAGA